VAESIEKEKEMSQWPDNEKESDPFEWLDDEEEPDTSKWPDYIECGFEMIYGEYIPDEEVEAFASRWGDSSLRTSCVPSLRDKERRGCLPSV
jgi:hypothetical protein